MAKPSAAMHTPRPSALRPPSSSTSSCSATRSSVGSTSSSTAAAAARNSTSNAAKVVAKCLVYDDDHFTLPSAVVAPAPHPISMKTADGLATEEDDLAPLLELPDPDVVSADNSASTSVVSAAADDALTASADSCVTEVPAAHADSATAAALPEEIINVALAELRGADGLSPRSKRFLAALGEAAALELSTNTAARGARLRLRRAGFWGKVRVAVLAATLAALVAADMGLAAYLYARRANERHGHAMLPPT